ncbi:nucleoside deaminase [Candidatus Gracilibacteria bacterium]|nr:nucleoside deaminase [Candidatus Gracilibacteria bacterium]
MSIHTKHLQQALDIALASAQKGTGPFACVITKDDQVIATGHNQVVELNDPTAHAEIQAIRAACKVLGSHQLTGCIIYSSSLPCPQCLGAIYWARPEAVYHANTAEEAAKIGFDDKFIYEEISKANEDRKYIMQKIEVPDALRAFEAWEQNPNKTTY